MKEKTKGLRNWIEIDSKAVLNNLKIFRKLVGKNLKIMSVVKSNAYGHSLWDFSNIIKDNKDLDWFGVDSVFEGVTLRKKGIKKPMLILGYTLPENYVLAKKYNLSLAISSFESLFEILKLNFHGKIKVHLKFDTGMHRHGFSWEEREKVLDIVKKNLSKIEIEGMFTHFAIAKDPNNRSYTNKQISDFTKLADFLSTELKIKPIKHASATGGALVYNTAHFDMVRIGIGMYGLWPSAESKKHRSKTLKLRPVLKWKTIVAETKNLKKGDGIGYDLTERLKRDSKIAILPIGYWHGFPRALSRVGYVYIKDTPCKVLGNVCMDIIMVDITEVLGVKVGCEVEIIGSNEHFLNSLPNMANLANMSVYELVTRINPLIKRIVR